MAGADNGGDGFLAGLLSVAGFQFLTLVAGGVSGIGWLASAVGLVQFAYVIPMVVMAKNRGLRKFTAGVVVAASIGAALNVAFWKIGLP